MSGQSVQACPIFVVQAAYIARRHRFPGYPPPECRTQRQPFAHPQRDHWPLMYLAWCEVCYRVSRVCPLSPSFLEFVPSECVAWEYPADQPDAASVGLLVRLDATARSPGAALAARCLCLFGGPPLIEASEESRCEHLIDRTLVA